MQLRLAVSAARTPLGKEGYLRWACWKALKPQRFFFLKRTGKKNKKTPPKKKRGISILLSFISRRLTFENL